MFLTKKSLSRRTILRGAGAAVALPLLDAMLPAFAPLAKAAAKPAHALRRRLLSERRHHAAVHSQDGRRRLRVHADSEAAGTVSRQA